MEEFKLVNDANQHQKIVEKLLSYKSEFLVKYSYELPKIDLFKIYKNSKFQEDVIPSVTVSLPVCNQDGIISNILNTLFDKIESPANLIIVLDACRDNSKIIVDKFIVNHLNPSNICEIIILESNGDLFESTCENLALWISDNAYFLSLQADIFFNDSTFITRALSAFDKYSDLLGISGRAVLPATNKTRYTYLQYINKLFNLLNKLSSKFTKKVFLMPFFTDANYFGDISTPPQSRLSFTKKQSKSVYLGDTVIRGPIMWRGDYIRDLGGFQDFRYFLGGDERQICIDGRIRHNMRVGYMPTKCYTNVWSGTSHSPEKRNETTLHHIRLRTDLQILKNGNFAFELDQQEYPRRWRGLVYQI